MSLAQIPVPMSRSPRCLLTVSEHSAKRISTCSLDVSIVKRSRISLGVKQLPKSKKKMLLSTTVDGYLASNSMLVVES